MIHPPYYNRLLNGTIATGVLMIFWGCFDGAPHSHPLDPRSDNFENTGSLSGTVTQYYPPFEGIDGVEVRLSPGISVTQTDGQGQFNFDAITPGRYKVVASKEGFATTADSVHIMLNERGSVTLKMDGLPKIRNFELQTVHLSRWWPPPFSQFWIDVLMEVQDPDGIGDIELAYLKIPFLDFSDTLQADLETGRYVTRLRENRIGASIASLIGHDIALVVQDRVGEEVSLPMLRLSRIIEETPIANEPSELAFLTTTMPTYSWSGVTLNYPFTYQVDVTRVDANIQTKVQSISLIPSDSLTVQSVEPLATGEYFWTVSIVDEFGNRSRSREAGFRIP